jgi:GMP synthase-like glutamine amidotransferase
MNDTDVNVHFLRVHCFQHVAFEDLGCIKEWCAIHGHPVTYTRFYINESMPEAKDFDWLIVMGGPMGVYEDEKYVWLSREKEAIKMAIEQNKTVLGICLGAQLIAEVMGARVYKNPEKEIGWFDIMLTDQGKDVPLTNGMRPVTKVFHWHGDTFDLPQNSIPVFYSEACQNQAFLYKDKVLGLQFHFEVTEQSLKAMIENGKQELTGEGTIQTEKEILSFLNSIEPNHKTMFHVLDNLAK